MLEYIYIQDIVVCCVYIILLPIIIYSIMTRCFHVKHKKEYPSKYEFNPYLYKTTTEFTTIPVIPPKIEIPKKLSESSSESSIDFEIMIPRYKTPEPEPPKLQPKQPQKLQLKGPPKIENENEEEKKRKEEEEKLKRQQEEEEERKRKEEEERKRQLQKPSIPPSLPLPTLNSSPISNVSSKGLLQVETMELPTLEKPTFEMGNFQNLYRKSMAFQGGLTQSKITPIGQIPGSLNSSFSSLRLSNLTPVIEQKNQNEGEQKKKCDLGNEQTSFLDNEKLNNDNDKKEKSSSSSSSSESSESNE